MADAQRFLESPWVNAQFLRGIPGNEIEVTVAKADAEDVRNPATGDFEEKIVMSFEETDKRYIPGKMVLGVIVQLFGGETNTTKWVGNKLKLYLDPTVNNPGGGPPGGVRVQPATGVFD